ncbi:MAG: glycosyl hydrolase family 17 protein, partial [Flavobacteriales bacterium]|nr:glycosyl hydrolase family 17 protein [Flavobacteriales bacterium]
AGAWISNDKERNELEIKNLIELTKKGKVDIAVIGNEVLLRGDITENELINYIEKVKQEVYNLGIKVGYVDTYFEYYQRPKLAEVCDVLLVNCYPFWEGVPVEDSLHSLRQMYEITKRLASGKQVIIAETGWPSQGKSVQNAYPTQLNAMRYFVEVQEWSKDEHISVFHFSSFDESWKAKSEGEVGARWGIWDKNEKLKYS